MNCPGISVGALKELAENRIVEATARGYGTDHHMTISRILRRFLLLAVGLICIPLLNMLLLIYVTEKFVIAKKYDHDIGTANRCPAL